MELLSSFRDTMRRNYETLDVEKVQEQWYASSLLDMSSDAISIRHVGAAVTSLGSSVNAGRNYLRISATPSQRSLTPPA